MSTTMSVSINVYIKIHEFIPISLISIQHNRNLVFLCFLFMTFPVRKLAPIIHDILTYLFNPRIVVELVNYILVKRNLFVCIFFLVSSLRLYTQYIIFQRYSHFSVVMLFIYNKVNFICYCLYIILPYLFIGIIYYM